MKVSLLTVIVVGVLPSQVVAQQPAYLRQATRVQDVQHTTPRPAQQQNSGNTRIEPEYRFPVAISITATGYHDGRQVENSVVTYYVNPTHGWVATPSPCEQKVARGNCSGLHIYDMKASTVLVVNTREKKGVSMSISDVAANTATKRRELKLPPKGENGCRCEATGKKRVIQGFNTVEYSCINPTRKTRFDMWVTRDLKTDFAAPGAPTELSGFMYRAARFNAVPLEGYYYVDEKLMSSLTLTGVNRAAQLLVKTADYQLNGGRN